MNLSSSFSIPCTLILLAILTTATSGPAQAWGDTGHKVVGAVAWELLDPKARKNLTDITGGEAETLGELCYWPDVMRPSPGFDRFGPWHYVNFPESAETYERQRDCADGDCNPEAIKRNVQRLMTVELDTYQRRESVAWVCHLVGDLHQPLHAGFASDRGANDVVITYLGEESNLHWLWDGLLIEHHRPGWQSYSRLLLNRADWPSLQWNPDSVSRWTAESRALTQSVVYPDGAEITTRYAGESLTIIDRRLRQAGQRLAQILNAALGNGEIELNRQ